MKHIQLFLVICFLLSNYITSLHAKSSSTSKSKLKNHLTLKSKTQVKAKSKAKQQPGALMIPGLGEANGDDLNSNPLQGIDSRLLERKSISPNSNEYGDRQSSSYTSNIDIVLQDWLTISSPSFRNQKKFPILKTQEDGLQEVGITQSSFQRINFFNFALLPEKYRPPQLNIFHKKKLKAKLTPQQEELLKKKRTKIENDDSKKDFFWFWFRTSYRYTYYSSNPTMLNQLGSINLRNLNFARNVPKSQYCFELGELTGDVYRICAINTPTKAKWLCFYQRYLKSKNIDVLCGGGAGKLQKFKERTIVQPVMLIPLPSKKCNEKWTYLKHGRDWECKCIEGKFKGHYFHINIKTFGV